ncbi:MAG: bifunctional phosphoribosylaminoimidazolecarboxamide formyltransferase/IMP cyclohydrolase [Planctomycetota bacterium]
MTGTRRRALLSVSDKAGIADFARQLSDAGYSVISTGGTARIIADAGVSVTPVEAVTGFPEMLDGRVKTLHPKIHGGLLGVRDDPKHAATMAEHGIEPIDIIAIDLYPFESTIAREGVSRAEAIEQIDIGGPAMIRSAAKNHASVTVITDVADYQRVIADIRSNDGATSAELRQQLAAKAFSRTCAYDAAIAGYLSQPEALPPRVTISLTKHESLRYGENPHQDAAVYRDGRPSGGILDAQQLHGKPLSFNNIADASAAWALVCTLNGLEPDSAGAVIVKHANPCGAAVAGDPRTAIDAAFAGDPIAAFGGILACNAPMTADAADRLCDDGVFLEVAVAPRFDDDAVSRLTARWKNLRLLTAEPPATPRHTVRLLPGGALIQTPDRLASDSSTWELMAGPPLGPESERAARVVEAVSQALSSNAVAIGGPDPERRGCVRLFGAGAGQMDRLNACKIAVEKAGGLAAGGVAVSDAFFPFSDGPAVLRRAGVAAIVHPGGSKRDGETFEFCKNHGISCLITGVRHFRHEPLR